MRVTVLGCGAAGGVPSLSRGWGRCDPNNSRNRRRRPAILVYPPPIAPTTVTDPEVGQGRASRQAQSGGEVLLQQPLIPDPILVDAGPDIRQQLLDVGVNHLSAVLLTHAHADHIHGIDDLREVNRAMGKALDLYSDAVTLESLEQRFAYAVSPQPPDTDYIFKPLLVSKRIERPFTVAGLTITAFEQDHGVMTSLGFRIGDSFAYSTDVVNLNEAAFEALDGVHTWMVGCMGWSELPTHAHLDKVLKWAERVQPTHLVLTHMGPGVDYDAMSRCLPDWAEPAYDGMILEVPDRLSRTEEPQTDNRAKGAGCGTPSSLSPVPSTHL